MQTEKMIEEFKKIDVCCVSDAADRLGINCALYGIKSVVPGTFFCGQAFTVHFIPCGKEKGMVEDYLGDVPAGQVVVIDNSGRDYCSVWGGMMAESAVLRGVAGTVIDGVCRDIPTLLRLKYPIFSKGSYMAAGRGRVMVDYVNRPISVSNTRIGPGDIIIGDCSGVVAIPLEYAEQVLKIAIETAEMDLKTLAAVHSGMKLKDARASANKQA